MTALQHPDLSVFLDWGWSNLIYTWSHATRVIFDYRCDFCHGNRLVFPWVCLLKYRHVGCINEILKVLLLPLNNISMNGLVLSHPNQAQPWTRLAVLFLVAERFARTSLRPAKSPFPWPQFLPFKSFCICYHSPSGYTAPVRCFSSCSGQHTQASTLHTHATPHFLGNSRVGKSLPSLE